MEKFRKFWKYGFVGGSGGGAPRSKQIFKELVEKSMETFKTLKIFMNFLRIFEYFLKFYRKFRVNLGEILERFGNMDL